MGVSPFDGPGGDSPTWVIDAVNPLGGGQSVEEIERGIEEIEAGGRG
jgi:hypothetical protein